MKARVLAALLLAFSCLSCAQREASNARTERHITLTACADFATDTLRCLRPIETATVCIREQVIPR